MPKYNVLVEWTVETWHEAEADTPDAAKERVAEALDCTDKVPAEEWIDLAEWLGAGDHEDTFIRKRIADVEEA